MHEGGRGNALAARRCAAIDPHFVNWVSIAEVDRCLQAELGEAVTPTTPAEADSDVTQACVVATRLGVLDPPRTVAELDDAIASYRSELEGTPAARDAARFLLLHPPLPWSARPGYSALAVAAIALLPPWAREHLDLPHLPLAEEAIVLPVGGAATIVIRWAPQHPRDPPRG